MEKNILISLLDTIHSYDESEYTNKTKEFLNENNLTQAADRIPLTESNHYKLYRLDSADGVADWVTINIDGKYYSANLYDEVSESSIIESDSEGAMIREFMHNYNYDKRACTLVINENYTAINTKTDLAIRPLTESVEEIKIGDTVPEDKLDRLYELSDFRCVNVEDNHTIYDLFTFVEEFKDEIDSWKALRTRLKTDEEFRKAYDKKYIEYAVENGIDCEAEIIEDMYILFLKETQC